jgi:WD40 repeat protein
LITGAVLADLPQQSKVYTVAWHPDGERLAVAGEAPQIQLWDVPRKKRTHLLECDTKGIRMVFNHAGTLLASNGRNGRLRLWDPNSGQLRFVTQAEHGTLCFSRDDRYLAATLSGPGRNKQEDGTRLKVYEVAMPREYRTFQPLPSSGRREFTSCAISPDQRWLAASTDDGVRLFDLAGGRERAFLPLGPTLDVAFEPGTNPAVPTLLTSHREGSYGWTLHPSPAAGGVEHIQVGPPELVMPARSPTWLASTPDGGVQAFGTSDPGVIWLQHRDRPGKVAWEQPQQDLCSLSVSPNGRWVATASAAENTVKVRDARTGEVVKELATRPPAQVAFSPDGRWLLVHGLQTGDGSRLWTTADWQPGPRLGGRAFAFAPDGKMVAVEVGRGVIRLVEPATGRDLARLEDPSQDVAIRLCFSPDGSLLASVTNDSRSIHLWDLRLIRRQLAQRGLDLELPPLGEPVSLLDR